MPSSVALCRERRAGQGADTPAMVTFASAPDRRGRPQLLAGRLPRLTGLTSYLSGCFCVCSWVTWFFTPPQFRSVYELCQTRSLPVTLLPLRARSCERPEPFGGVDPPGNTGTCWCYCSSHNPLGNSISMRIETILRPDSVRARFLSSRLTAQFLIRVLSGSGTTPTRGTGEICLAVNDCSLTEGLIEPASINLSPVARDYPSRALEGVFQIGRAHV